MASRPESSEVPTSEVGEVAGRESTHGSGNTAFNETKACRQVKQKRRNEAATEDLYHDGYDEKNQCEGQNWTQSVNCCLLIVKKWLHPEWEDTVQHWKTWLHDMKKKDEKKRQEEEHQKLVSRIITSAQGGAGLLHKKSRNPLIVNEEKNCWRRKGRCQTFGQM